MVAGVDAGPSWAREGLGLIGWRRGRTKDSIERTGKTILTGIVLGVVIGVVVGVVGAILDLHAAVRGGLIGALVAAGFFALHRRSQSGPK